MSFAVTAAVVTTGATVYSAYKGAEEAERAGDRADRQQQSSESIARTQQRIAEEEFARFTRVFAPLEKRIAEYTEIPIAGLRETQRGLGLLSRDFGTERAQLERDLAQRFQFGGSLPKEFEKNLRLQESQAKAGFVADVAQNRFANMIAAANLGRGLPGQAQSGLGS